MTRDLAVCPGSQPGLSCDSRASGIARAGSAVTAEHGEASQAAPAGWRRTIPPLRSSSGVRRRLAQHRGPCCRQLDCAAVGRPNASAVGLRSRPRNGFGCGKQLSTVKRTRGRGHSSKQASLADPAKAARLHPHWFRPWGDKSAVCALLRGRGHGWSPHEAALQEMSRGFGLISRPAAIPDHGGPTMGAGSGCGRRQQRRLRPRTAAADRESCDATRTRTGRDPDATRTPGINYVLHRYTPNCIGIRPSDWI